MNNNLVKTLAVNLLIVVGLSFLFRVFPVLGYFWPLMFVVILAVDIARAKSRAEEYRKQFDKFTAKPQDTEPGNKAETDSNPNANNKNKEEIIGEVLEVKDLDKEDDQTDSYK